MRSGDDLLNTRMPASLRNLFTSLVTGYILFFFSELLFWARPRPEDSLLNWVETWLAYSWMAFLFLVVVDFFRVRSLPALFLSGAFFGWLAEGVVVQTAYQQLPLSLSFTGLAWHALITVLAGWYGLQKALRDGRRRALCFSALLGLFLWFWGISWLFEEPQVTVRPAVFGIFSLTITLALMTSLYLASKSFAVPFVPSRWGVMVSGGLFLIYFIFVTIPAAPSAAVIFPLLMLILFTSLRRNRSQEMDGSLLEILAKPAAAPVYLSLLIVPIVASGLYSLCFYFEVRLPTHWVVYLVTTPTGFGLLAWSLWRIWRKPRQERLS